MQKKFKLIGFDLDGTLINSLPDLTLALNLTFQEAGLPQVKETEVVTWIGKGIDVLFSNAINWTKKQFSDDEVANLKERFHYFYSQNLCTSSELFPNVRETLETLSKEGYILAVVTNKPTRYVKPILTALNIDHFFAEAIGGHTLPAIKPHPAPIYYLYGKFACYPNEVLFVGDSCNDILAARAAGCTSVGLSYGYNYNIPLEESNPDYYFDDFAKILTIL